MIMIDPKVIELSVYEDIPHLLAPVVTEPPKAVVALKWVVRQMDERYRLMSHLGVRDIFAFNKRLLQARGQRRGAEAPGADRLRARHGRADLRGAADRHDAAAADRRHRRRGGGPDADGRQGDRERDPAPVAEGPRRRHPPDRGDPAAVGRRADRRDQGQPALADQLPGQLQDRQPHHPGRAGCRAAPGPGRHALSDARRPDQPHPRRPGHRRRGRAASSATSRRRASRTTTRTSPRTARASRSRTGRCSRLPAVRRTTVYTQAVQVVARDGKASTSYLQRKLAIGYNSAAKLIERMENEGLISRGRPCRPPPGADGPRRGRRHRADRRPVLSHPDPTDVMQSTDPAAFWASLLAGRCIAGPRRRRCRRTGGGGAARSRPTSTASTRWRRASGSSRRRRRSRPASCTSTATAAPCASTTTRRRRSCWSHPATGG